MDADRFDALSRALSTGHTRRRLSRLLGGLSLGGVLSALGSDETAAAPLNGGATCTDGSQCKTGKCLSTGKCSCSRDFPTCKQPANRCKQATCDFGTKRCETKNTSQGTTCNDGMDCTVNDACDGQGHCIGTPKHGRCPSADPCTLGRCRPTDASRDANGCVFTPITTGECAEGTCSTNSDCCPAERPGCASETGGNLYKSCVNGDCVCNSADYPHACFFSGNPSECHQCCNSDDCVLKTGDPNRVCSFGNCVCEGDKPKLCVHKGAGGTTYCTDPRSDPENCSPFIEDCGFQCNPGQDCVNGRCTSPG